MKNSTPTDDRVLLLTDEETEEYIKTHKPKLNGQIEIHVNEKDISKWPTK